ncbi:uncharacterized protein SPEM2 isoform X2 [Monodelphis domestica]|uniref:uncharacterized protein SPEM2 isoform X2 n=1 Tax=Monodelphis domestica TaxID=13616 RepID=UPI00044362DF|nr:uncharacterized protein SPEM2 isoform X2 [Monodelphis domestica]
MAEQVLYESQRHYGHHARNIDPVDAILLLISLIILVNLGINVMILICRSLLRSLHGTFVFFRNEGKFSKKPQNSDKKPSGFPTLCIHCTLDPVALNVAHTALNRRRRDPQNSGSGQGSYKGSCRGRRERARQYYLQHRHQPRICMPQSPPSSAPQPTAFCCQETWDTDLDDCKDSQNPQSNYQQSWNTTHPPGNVRHYRQCWRSYYPEGSNLPPQDQRAPRRVEAKSELRLETYYQSPPTGWPQNIKENMEPAPTHNSPPFTQRFPPDPSCMPGTHNPIPPNGQIVCETYIRQRPQDAKGFYVPKAPQCVLKNPEPQSYADAVPKRNTIPNRTQASGRHSSFINRDRSEIKRKEGEPKIPIVTSISFCRFQNHEPQNYLASAPNENQIPEVSQPSTSVSARVPASEPCHVPAFTPLSRNPGGITNCQVYDSLELKRQIQEGRGRRGETYSSPPVTTPAYLSTSWHSPPRTKAGRMN